jgi:hypothetical protein
MYRTRTNPADIVRYGLLYLFIRIPGALGLPLNPWLLKSRSEAMSLYGGMGGAVIIFWPCSRQVIQNRDRRLVRAIIFVDEILIQI